MMIKKKVGIISNCVCHKTGLARDMKSIVPLLYKTGKYDIYFLNQQTPDNHEDFIRLPWKNFGVFRNFDQNRFNQDQGYRSFVSYGNTTVESFVIDNKLDVVIASDDPWAFQPDQYFKTEWYKHIKKNFLARITADSEPILPLIKEWAENCPNMTFWTEFAERILKEEDPKKYGHCKTIYGAININDFTILPRWERNELRKKFGISAEEKICLFLGRNQLRKTAIWANQEALAKFRQRISNKNKKIRLLFHMNFSEPGGWPIDQIRDELKLNKEDILCTYYCRNCGDWNIQPHDGEDLDCKVCNAQKSRITAGVGSTINEKDLNKIYNVADFSCSNFTSAGLEFTNVESLLAGLPLGCVNYSGGETFCKNDFVFKIKGNFTRECGSGFKKFVPNIDSIADFYERMFDLSSEKREEIVKRGREWAVNTFNGEIIARQLEQFIDSCESIDWEEYHNKRKELKNPNAQINLSLDDDFEFVCSSYESILNMRDMRDKNKPETKHWLDYLSQHGKDKMQLRQEMLNIFRNIAAQKNQEINPITIDSLLDKNDKERVLLVLKESLGDCYIISSLLPEIKLKYPNATIYLATDPKYFEVFDMIDVKCIPWSQDLENELYVSGQGNHKGLFNYFHNIGLTTQRSLNYLSSKY